MTESDSRKEAGSKCHANTRKGYPQPDTSLLEPTILPRLAQRVEEQNGAQVEMLYGAYSWDFSLDWTALAQLGSRPRSTWDE